MSQLIHFSKGTSTVNFKTARDSGCRSLIFQVKTDSVSGKIHLLFPALRFLEAGLSFEKSLLKWAFILKISVFSSFSKAQE